MVSYLGRRKKSKTQRNKFVMRSKEKIARSAIKTVRDFPTSSAVRWVMITCNVRQTKL